MTDTTYGQGAKISATVAAIRERFGATRLPLVVDKANAVIYGNVAEIRKQATGNRWPVYRCTTLTAGSMTANDLRGALLEAFGPDR
jgi:hypothetical protein